MDNNDFYHKKFINFLRANNLYEYRVVNYYFKYATFNEYQNFDLTKALDNWSYIYNLKGKLVKIIPCTPALKNERAVLFNILCYIKLLYILFDVNFACISKNEFGSWSKFDEFGSYTIRTEDVNEFILLFYYGMLYIKNNPNIKLSNYEKKSRQRILKNGSDLKQSTFKFCEQAIEKDNNTGIENITRLVRKKLKTQQKTV